jgi:hypothetical protein
MLRSTDGGNNWKKASVAFKCGGNDYGRSVDERLVVDPNKGNILLMGTRQDGLWKSIDSSKIWKKISAFPVTTTLSTTGITFVKFIKESGSGGTATPLIYIGVARRGATNLYFSADTGITWQPVPGQSDIYMPVHAANVADSLLYIAYSDTSGPYLATAGNLMKLNIKTGVFTDVSPRKPGVCAYSGISVYPPNPNIIYASTLDLWPDEIYRSIDAGKSWNAILGGSNRHNNGYKYVDPTTYHWISDVEVNPFNPDNVFFVTGFGIWSTTNASNIDNSKKVDWFFTDKGLEESVVQEINSPAFGAPLVTAIYDYDGFRNDSLDIPSKYGNFLPSIGSTTGLAVAEKEPSIMARVGNSGQYSLNGGIGWKSMHAPAGGNNGQVAISADGKTIVWSPKTLIPYYSRNYGATWNECSGITVTGMKVIADRVNPDKFYCYDSSTGDVYESIDGGENFSIVSTVSSGGGTMSATLGKEGDLWIPFNGSGLMHSVNSGANFNWVATVSSAIAIGTGKAYSGNNYPLVFIIGTVAGLDGIYRSDDTCKTWKRINDNQHNFGGINLITGDSREPGRVYVASNYNGIGVIYGMPLEDCNGDSTGTAYLDECNVCVGGKTGLNGCTMDCNGVKDGTATIDKCGFCVGGTSGKIDCTTEIKENKTSSLNLYPNPFTRTIQIQTIASTEYRILNIIGKVEESGICSKSCMVGKNLKQGIYLIELKTRDEIKTVKIIKQ